MLLTQVLLKPEDAWIILMILNRPLRFKKKKIENNNIELNCLHLLSILLLLEFEEILYFFLTLK